MRTNYLLGIDIGTQGTKTVLFSESGELIAQSFQKSNLIKNKENSIEEDPEEQLSAVCNTIKDCMLRSQVNPSHVAGLAITGQMAGIIGINQQGYNVTPYDSWLDTRCEPYIRKMEQEAGSEILFKTGNYPSYNHGPKILWWKNEFPEIYSRISSFVQPAGYAALRLCGLDSSLAYIDNTYLHFSGFADNKGMKWDDGLCSHFGIDKSKLPAITEPSAIVGKIEKQMAKLCNLVEGIPVIAGCGDTAASFLSVGAVKDGICVDVAGTASVFATTTKAFICDEKFKTIGCGRSAISGLWHPYAYINGGGMNIEWFVENFNNTGEECRISVVDLNRIASKLEPEVDDPFFIPHLGGRVCPSQPKLRGAWTNLQWNHSFSHLFRAILEGVALEYGLYSKILKQIYSGYSPKEIRIVGGGSKSELWNQLKADVLGIPVSKSAREEGAPMGAALIAGFGAGLYDDPGKMINKWNVVQPGVKPRNEFYNHYKRRIDIYENLINILDNSA